MQTLEANSVKDSNPPLVSCQSRGRHTKHTFTSFNKAPNVNKAHSINFCYWSSCVKKQVNRFAFSFQKPN